MSHLFQFRRSTIEKENKNKCIKNKVTEERKLEATNYDDEYNKTNTEINEKKKKKRVERKFHRQVEISQTNLS